MRSANILTLVIALVAAGLLLSSHPGKEKQTLWQGDKATVVFVVS